MPSPKSGKAIPPVAPTAPKDAVDADVTQKGSAEAAKSGGGSTPASSSAAGSASSRPASSQPNSTADPEKKSWVEIQMVDEEDMPVSGVSYNVKIPDGTFRTGSLNGEGLARIEGIDPGTCEISFPDLDRDAWEKI